MVDGLSVHKTAARPGEHRTTAFRWCHRGLQVAREIKARHMTGVAKRGTSAEHTPNLVRVNRHGEACDHMPRPSSSTDMKAALLGTLAWDAVL